MSELEEVPPPSNGFRFLGSIPFNKAWLFNPLAVAFINLPYKVNDKVNQIITFVDGSPCRLVLKSGYAGKLFTMDDGSPAMTKEKYDLGLPSGMTGRRILMRFFSESFKYYKYIRSSNGYPIFACNINDTEIYKFFGYDNGGNGHRFQENNNSLVSVLKMSVAYEDDDLNTRCGFQTRTQICDNTFIADIAENGYYDNIYVNPQSLFNPAIPINFDHVIHTKKKVFFWNVYVILADLLYRIKEGYSFELDWRKLHNMFGMPYSNVASFKFNFCMTLDEVLELYTEAKNSVDYTTNKKHLIVKHAPALTSMYALPTPPTPPPNPPTTEPTSSAMQVPSEQKIA